MNRLNFFDNIVLVQYHMLMPKKVGLLIQRLKKAGFVDRGGKGNHRNFTHPSGAKITISGNGGQEAKKDQERAVEKAIGEVAK